MKAPGQPQGNGWMLKEVAAVRRNKTSVRDPENENTPFFSYSYDASAIYLALKSLVKKLIGRRRESVEKRPLKDL